MKKTWKPNLSIYLSIFFHFSKPASCGENSVSSPQNFFSTSFWQVILKIDFSLQLLIACSDLCGNKMLKIKLD